MKLILCLDDQNGMLFNGRRLSRDQIVCDKILALAAGNKLWMNSYSAKLFSNKPAAITIDEAFLDRADSDDFCFTENVHLDGYLERVSEIILFHWNRRYPADSWFDLDLSQKPWVLTHTESFPGKSHDEITMEVYKR